MLSAIPALLTLNVAQAQVAEVMQWEVISDIVVEQSDRYVERGVGYFTENTFTLSGRLAKVIRYAWSSRKVAMR